MANEKRLIDANEFLNRLNSCVYDLLDTEGELGYSPEIIKAVLGQTNTVDAVEVKCKVGNLVYALWEAPVKQKYIIYCAEIKEIRIAVRNCRLTTTYILEPIYYRGHRREYRHDEFGKLVFPSETEAEAALAKMDGDDE